MPMEQNEALNFYERITEGKKKYDVIELEHSSGATLSGVEMHPVDKRTLAGVIEELPAEMFEAAEDVENVDEAEEQIREEADSTSAISEDTVTAFEELCDHSLDHDELTTPQMRSIIQELGFATLFELGTEIIDMSSEKTGDVQSFRKQG
jgi:DNA polymerase II large subunit